MTAFVTDKARRAASVDVQVVTRVSKPDDAIDKHGRFVGDLLLREETNLSHWIGRHPTSAERRPCSPTPPPVAEPVEAAPRHSFLNQRDAPPCHTCGAIMYRSGACYKCNNCGATSGCT